MSDAGSNELKSAFETFEPAMISKQKKTGNKEMPEPANKDAAAGKREKIDHGKIRALRNAGWSIEKIADEMRLTTKTIYYSLNKTKEDE